MRTFAELALFTDDVDAASAFYRALLAAPSVAEWPGGALYAVGEGKLLIHERAAAMTDRPPNEDHLAIGVDDIDAACTSLVAGGLAFLVEPRDYPWGRSAYLRDPDR